MKSHFFAYISKIRWISRWGLKRNAIPENVMEHSWEVATVAHCLALLRKRRFGGDIDVNAVVVAALYHDCSEVMTGDLPSPIKYHSAGIRSAYKAVELQAEHALMELLPDDLREDFAEVLLSERIPREHKKLIKAADTICALLKCQSELAAGNREFVKAAEGIEVKLKSYSLPEVDLFLSAFAPSYQLTLDELASFGASVDQLNDDERRLLT